MNRQNPRETDGRRTAETNGPRTFSLPYRGTLNEWNANVGIGTILTKFISISLVILVNPVYFLGQYLSLLLDQLCTLEKVLQR